MGSLRDGLRRSKEAPRKRIEVDVPGLDLDGPVLLQQLLAGEMQGVYGGGEQALPLMLTRMVINADGSRQFTDDERDYFNAMPLDSFGVLMAAANKLNGFGEKEAEKTIKNSEAGQSAVSVSA